MTLVFFIISLTASIIGAISGIGGGIIIKPLLDASKSMSINTISFLSGCTVLAMTTVSLVRNRNGEVNLNLRLSTFLGIGAAIGGILGKELFDAAIRFFATQSIVGIIQSSLLLLITISVFLYMRFKEHIHTKQITSSMIAILIGFVLGIISTFLGIGGGPLNIALLYYYFSMDGKTAALNSLYIIFIAQAASLISAFLEKSIPTFEPFTLFVMIIGGVAGALIGYSINKKLVTRHVEVFFCWVLVVIAFINIWNIIRYLA